MGNAQFSYSFDFTVICCAHCGMPFGMSNDFSRRKSEKGGNFFCPSGHSNIYTETEVKKLQKQLDQEKKRREWAEQARERSDKSAIAYRGQVTKLKNRVGNGVCPCCNRSFQNLRRHIAGQHPDFKGEK